MSDTSKDPSESSQQRNMGVDDQASETVTSPPQIVSVIWPAGARKDVTIPLTIGNVKVEGQIGRGGMGVVFRGWDAVLQRRVAVKFLLGLAAHKDDPHFERFFGGARAEAALRHPNIVPVYAGGVVEGIAYIVMEYVDGPTLRKLTKHTGPLSLPAAVKVMWNVAGAVAALHERDIIHRDLKPANVLFDREGHLLVTDFGLASLRRRSDSPVSTAGTPMYMAPETFDGKGSPQSDVYAMGIMLFELLTGRLPFTGDLASLRDQHANAPLPLVELPDSTPASIVEIIERAAHKKDMFRYKSAERFQRALRNSVATDELLHEGSAELKTIVFKLHDKEPIERSVEESDQRSSSTYFERLSELADNKRVAREPSHLADAADDEPVGGGLIPGDQPTPTPAATLKADVSCVQCGYNLRGLSASGKCPECGGTVASSLQRDRLLFADPSWLKHMMRGQTLIFAAITANFLLGVAIVAIVVILEGMGVSIESAKMLRRTPRIVIAIIMISPIIISIVGVFLSTAAEPRASQEAVKCTTRRLARVCLLLLVGSVTTYIALRAIRYAGVDSEVWSVLTWGAMFGTVVSFLLYLSTLAARIPDRPLAKESRDRAVLLGPLVILAVSVQGSDMLIGSGLEDGLTEILSMFAIYWLWRFTRRCRKAVKRVVAAGVSYDTLFGDVPTEIAFASTVIENPPAAQPSQSSLQTTEDTLQVGVWCVACRYDLRGLSARGHCPECNASISASLRPERLLFASGTWLSRTAVGLSVIIWGLGIGVPLSICVLRIGIAIAQRTATPKLVDGTVTIHLPTNILMVMGGTAMLATFVAFAIGLLIATSPESHSRVGVYANTSRRAARILILLFSVLLVAMLLFPPSTFSSALEIRPELAIVLLGSAVLSFVHYLGALGARIPHSRLARRSRWIAAIVVALLFLSVIPSLFGFVSNLMAVGLVPTIVAMFVLSIWFRRAFRHVAGSSVSYENLFGDVKTEETDELPIRIPHG